MVPSTVSLEPPDASNHGTKNKKKTWILLGSILTTLVVMSSLLVAWDDYYDKHFNDVSSSASSIVGLQDDDDNGIDDDATRDGICKAYLMQFLNGTTDARDVCEGMLNAYEAADCTDYGVSSDIDNDDDNHTNDDVLIDDTYEAWECCSSIYKYYKVHCHEPELASFQLLGIVLVLVLCGLVKSLIQTLNVMWIPDAAAFILVGATVGGIVKLISPRTAFANDQNLSSFNNNLFLHILLPPIVFASSLKINKRAFWRFILPILSLAVFGTALSAILIGYMTHGLSSLHHSSTTSLPLLDSLIFGSLASSIDPVATLGILDAVGVSSTDTLYILVFGESLLNDGVAIVLFEALVQHVGSEKITVGETITRFLVVSGGSVLIGLACGLVCMLYYWALQSKHSCVVEVAMFFCWALVPYYISDGIGLSGIISIMTAGFVMDYFVIGGCRSEEAEWVDYVEFQCSEDQDATIHARNSSTCVGIFQKLKTELFSGRGTMSKRSCHHVGFVSDVIASLMEMAIFAYLGLFLFSDKYMIDVGLNATAVFGCVVSRAVMILVVSAVINTIGWLDVPTSLHRLFSRNQEANSVEDHEEETTVESSIGSESDKILFSKNTQWILFLSGVRGAVSFALVENLPVYNALTKQGSLYKAELKAMTSSSILFTVFVFGASTYFTVRNQAREAAVVRHGRLTERLLSQPLASFEYEDDSREGSSFNTPNNDA